MGGQNATVEEVLTDLERITARKKVRDVRLWPRIAASATEAQSMIDYASSLLKVPIPEVGSISTHAIRMLREQFLTWAWDVIKDIDPNNPHINLMNDKAPLPSALSDEGPQRVAPEPFPTSGHEHIIAGIDSFNKLLPPELKFVRPEAIMPEPCDIAWALKQLRAGKQVGRSNWNGKGMWLKLQVPDANSKMTLPYIYIEYPVGSRAYPEGCRVPWLASQTDLLAQDWVIIIVE